MGMHLTLLSPLEKVMPGQAVAGGFGGFSMLQNEKKSFQLLIEAPCRSVCLTVQSELGGIHVYTVEYMPSNFAVNKKTADDYVLRSMDGTYPDLLLPAGQDIDLSNGRRVIWFEIIPQEPMPAGKYSVEITAAGETDVQKCSLIVEVVAATLPKQELIYTNWFHTDCLMDEYGVEAFSPEYWRIVKNYLKTAAEHGMNCVLTPLFTPPLDTAVGGERATVQLVDISYENKKYTFCFDKLHKWVKTAQACGMEYFELSHFFTQWGAKHAPKVMAVCGGKTRQIFGWKTPASSPKYRAFLTALAGQLKPFLENLGLKDKVLVHVSDEPQRRHYFTYKRASALVHSLFDGYRVVDALSEFLFYERGIVTTPIVANNHIAPFLGKVPEVWTYYCCGQDDGYVSNRFFSTPSERNRVLGFQLYKYNAAGFLHWGYNFWYTRYSKKKINPYAVTDAGGSFQSGDSFVVYPKADGTAYVSLRFKVFYDGLQDMLALKTLESLTSREYALGVLEAGLPQGITFSQYPHSPGWLLETRERINMAIKAHI